MLIKKHLRDIMNNADLDNLTSRMVRANAIYKKEADLN